MERKAARLGSLWASPKRAKHEPNVRPIPLVSTLDLGETVEIRVRDNGTGIPEDIVAKAHVGTITVTCPSLDTTVSGDVLGFGSVASARFKALGDRPRSRDRRQAWPENAGTGRKRSKEDAMRHLSHGRMNAGLSAWPGANSDDL
ncbi:MAG: ATP-binding protein [Acetobacteraceae bacterium]|nr:ATP-binding protein [Acetobacteraceae bacterium]